MRKTLFIFSLSIWFVTNALGATTKKITLSELEDKIAGAWIGQMIGNIYGLPFENKFVENHGPENWPYGYTKNLDKLRKTGGAFSDDDTDVEYMYLIQMEKYGFEPTYQDITEAWMYHIRDRVWLANRAALGLMHYGMTPPFTGRKDLNPHWYQIDPQLINEIWAYTAPGMVDYAAQKSDWAARITSDDWAVGPTVHYGAMYANAFFETDVEKLVIEGLKQLPQENRYYQTVKDMIALYKKYPDDWKKAWHEMADKYYVNEPAMTKTIWNANLNGACGVLAMLYGRGDFQLTLDLSCAMGFDADNQAATVSGILGVMYGAKALPTTLSMPIEEWTLPFNDRYINVTRYDLPDVTISNMISRTVTQAIKVVEANGGKLTGKGDKKTLVINTSAKFNPPLEFCVGPMPRLEVGHETEYEFYCAANQKYNWSLKSGKLPAGLRFDKGRLTGTPQYPGKYTIELALDNGRTTLTKSINLLVRSANIAPRADTIYCNVRELNEAVLDSCWYTFGKPMYARSVNVINDGVVNGEGSVFYTLAGMSNIPKVDYIGYGWNKPETISMIGLHIGCMEEFGGWWSSLNIQYQDEEGKWKPVEKITCTPEFAKSDVVFFQPHFVEYIMEFAPVTTKAIRLIGDTKIEKHWHKYTKNVSGFTSVTEMSVYK